MSQSAATTLPWLGAILLGVAGDGMATPRFLALGDSYTLGEGVAPAECWPNQLLRALRERGLQLAEPEIVARTGWTTDELAAALTHQRLRPPYALVTLLIGVNDQYRGRDLAAYPIAFTALLDRAIALAGGQARRVVVISIPDWGVTPYAQRSGRDRAAIAREIDAYNASNARIAAARQAHYVDVTTLSRAGGADRSLLVADGLHPSAAMYARWTQAILPAAWSALTAH
jgi:lysophospholipase L1-like esterase